MFPKGNGSCLNEYLQTLWTTSHTEAKGTTDQVPFWLLAALHLHELGRTWGLLPPWELLISSTFLLHPLSSKIRCSCRLNEVNLGSFLGAMCLNSHYKQRSPYAC